MKDYYLSVLLGILITSMSSCDQLNYAYLVNDTTDSIDVVLSIINPSEVKLVYPYRILEGDSTSKIYKLSNNTTRIEFKLCGMCEFEMFFDTAPLKARYLYVDTLKIINKSKIIQYNTREDILNAFIEREHYTKKYLIIK